MREFIHRPAQPMLSVMLTGVRNRPLIEGIDAAARCVQRKRADMLRNIVKDWLEAWEASGGAGSMESPGCPTFADDTRNPLLGHRVPSIGSAGGVIVPFRPRLVPPAGEPET
jgi:hypothetical protein